MRFVLTWGGGREGRVRFKLDQVCCTNICAGTKMGVEASSKGSRVCQLLLVTVTHHASLKYILCWPDSVRLSWYGTEGLNTLFSYGAWAYFTSRTP